VVPCEEEKPNSPVAEMLASSKEARQYKSLGPKPRRNVVDLDRELDPIQEAYIWIDILECNILKFRTRSMAPSTRPVTEAERGYCIMQDVFVLRIGRTYIDLLYEIAFPLSVMHFRLWIEGQKDKTIDIIDLRDTEMAVQRVKFENPVQLVYPYLSINISYTFNLREFPSPGAVPSAIDEFVTRNMGPCLHVGMVQNKIRKDMQNAVSPGTANFLPMKILPVVTLDDGTVYDKNLVTIDVNPMIY